MKSRPTVSFTDPRLRQNRLFPLASGQTVSSEDNGVWVAETDRCDWERYAETLGRLMRKSHGIAYATYLRWPTLRADGASAFAEVFEDVATIDDWLLVAAKPLSSFPDTVFRLRRQLGGNRSGLWSFGVTSDYHRLLLAAGAAGPDADSPIEITAAALPWISCALCLDDGVTMAFVKLTDQTIPVVEELERRLLADCEVA